MNHVCAIKPSKYLPSPELTPIPVLMILIPFSLHGATLSPGGVDSLVDTEHNEERYRGPILSRHPLTEEGQQAHLGTARSGVNLACPLSIL